jgi:hypothetical protein
MRIDVVAIVPSSSSTNVSSVWKARGDAGLACANDSGGMIVAFVVA